MTPEQRFPEHREDIRRLREQDPIFEEICGDYELIAGLSGQNGPEDGAVAECLEGLAQEIERALTRRDGGSVCDKRMTQ